MATALVKNSRAELLNAKPGTLFLRYLFPSVAATMMVALNFFIDTLCVGNALGQSAIAALNISQPLPGVLYGFGYLFGVGGATLYSACLGKGEKHKAKQVYTTCFTALLLIVVSIGVLGLVFLDPLTAFMTSDAVSLRPGVHDYLLYTFILAPFFGIETFLVTFVRNDGAPRISMISTFCSCSLNIILDVLFVVVFRWGIWSAALATSVAVVLSSVILFSSTFRAKSSLRFVKKGFSARVLFSAIRLGVPSFLSELTATIVTLTFNSVLLVISGQTAVEVYGVIASMTLVVGNGLAGVSNAMHALVSINAGAGKQLRVRSLLKMTTAVSLGLAAFFTLLGEVWPQALIRVFVQPDSAFMAMAVPSVRIVFVSYVFVAMNLLLCVYFQAVQAPGEALTLTLMRGVLFPVGTVMGFAVFMGVNGVWAAIAAAEVLALLLGVWLFARVERRLRDKNYERLQYFGRRRAPETVEGILDELGAGDLTGFLDIIERSKACDERSQGVPAYIGLDDLTSDYEGGYSPAAGDEDMGLLLAVGALLFTDLYEQDDSYMREKKLDDTYPAAAPAMSALARMCFRFIYNDETGETQLVPHLGHAQSEQKDAPPMPQYFAKGGDKTKTDTQARPYEEF